MHYPSRQGHHPPEVWENAHGIRAHPSNHHASSSEKWLPTGALVLQDSHMILDDIRVPQTLHFSPGGPFPLQPIIPHDASISPFARISTGVISPQSGHFPERAGDGEFESGLMPRGEPTCRAFSD